MLEKKMFMQIKHNKMFFIRDPSGNLQTQMAAGFKKMTLSVATIILSILKKLHLYSLYLYKMLCSFSVFNSQLLSKQPIVVQTMDLSVFISALNAIIISSFNFFKIQL